MENAQLREESNMLSGFGVEGVGWFRVEGWGLGFRVEGVGFEGLGSRGTQTLWDSIRLTLGPV